MRTLKIAGIAVGCLIVLLIVLLIAAALFINPNNYRSRIETAVRQSTGRPLVLSGNLHLRVFPTIALRFGPASLGNPPGFPSTPFLTLQEASLRVGLLPLLHGQLRIGRIQIDGLDAHLLRDAQGRGNWQTPATPASASSPTAAPAGTSQPVALPQLAGLTLRDARVSYNELMLNGINLTVGRVAEAVPVPVTVRLQVQRPAPAQPILLSGSLQLTDQPEALRVSALDLQLDQSHIRGALALTGQTNQAVNFNLNIDQLDLDRYRSSQTKASAATATPAASAPMQLPTSTLSTLRMDGTLNVGTLKLDGITLTQVSLRALASNGVTHVAPVDAHLYDGVYHGEVTLDARGAVPVVMTTQTLQNVNVAQLLQAFAGTQRLLGNGNVSAMLTGQGADTDALLHTLDGTVVVNLTHGAIEGIDLPFEVEQAEALIQRHTLPGGHGSGRTTFETFHASADLHDGVATTKDLDIATQLARVRGQGTLNLLTEAVNYQLQVALLKPTPAATAASGATLAQVPLDVTGTVASPQVRPDLQQLAKTQVQRQLQQQLQQHGGQVQKQVQSVLKGLFGGSSQKK